MSDKSPHIVTKTTETGVAISDYDRVDFLLAFAAQGASADDAKKRLDPMVVAFKHVVETLRCEDIGFDKLAERPNVVRNYEYDRATQRNVENGFTASHTASFQIASVDKVAAVYDRLAALDGVGRVSYEPKLEHENLIRLQADAFDDAFARAVARTKRELATVWAMATDDQMIGLQPASFDKEYDDSLSAGRSPRRGARAMAASMSLESAGGGAGQVDPTELGKATVTCTVTVHWTACDPAESFLRDKSTPSDETDEQ